VSVAEPHDTGHACLACIRRSELLASIAPRLEIRSRLRGRLLELLALGDDELLAAVGVRSPAAPRVSGLAAARSPPPQRICRHDPLYPAALGDDGGPRLLHLRGHPRRLKALAERPAVAICGSSRATDYGIEVAGEIARELAVYGVTIVSGLADAVGAAAQQAALAAGGEAIAVLAGGHEAGLSAPRRALAKSIARQGCVVAELPQGCGARVWGRIAAARVLARLASVTLVVEADETPVDMAPAEAAVALGRKLAAVPGRVTSPASRGTHALLIGGAHLVRAPSDVLALLGRACRASAHAQQHMDPALRATLELVGAGADTAEKLARHGKASHSVLLELSRLELLGLLARGDGGRYVVRASAPTRATNARGARARPSTASRCRRSTGPG
jgi:DNA processing protein